MIDLSVKPVRGLDSVRLTDNSSVRDGLELMLTAAIGEHGYHLSYVDASVALAPLWLHQPHHSQHQCRKPRRTCWPSVSGRSARRVGRQSTTTSTTTALEPFKPMTPQTDPLAHIHTKEQS